MVFWCCLRLARNRVVALACTLLFAASPQLRDALQLNTYAVSNLFAVLSFAFLALPTRIGALALLLSGASLGIAIGSKLYYLAIIPGFAAFLVTP